ncbi:hypothetical protein MAPG_00526 [Magnaporthiopsis poae ATCC 64411]|uniref:Uncharacterized protein n=1 Tax=Magnaporthiopsis poae (strain ATCC 64411 / 73-15) TaxID=644358 RepID=A0A0C4DL86_MAGP6|nr:hypothetical protein MAPG_00526 [Magnaporthiopsis poae ATCC 64411]
MVTAQPMPAASHSQKQAFPGSYFLFFFYSCTRVLGYEPELENNNNNNQTQNSISPVKGEGLSHSRTAWTAALWRVEIASTGVPQKTTPAPAGRYFKFAMNSGFQKCLSDPGQLPNPAGGRLGFQK